MPAHLQILFIEPVNSPKPVDAAGHLLFRALVPSCPRALVPSQTMLHIGPHPIAPNLILAPMAGVTDKPFRQLCKRLGAGLAVSEMTTSDARLWDSKKSRWRMDHEGEPAPISVQIAGYDPRQLADAARFNVDHGADIIDINMGCPAKKVCKVDAGSALMRDEALIGRILDAVVAAASVPVTLKIRTGWCRAVKNGPAIAQIAQSAGIAALAVHGRTREDMYEGEAEYATIAEIKSRLTIPVLANGDVDTPEKAREVLRLTGCDGLLIGRAAQGRPWIFREVAHFLATGEHLPVASDSEIAAIMLGHLQALYAFYGEHQGTRIARKHLGWYAKTRADGEDFRREVVRFETAAGQYDYTAQWLAGDTWAQAA